MQLKSCQYSFSKISYDLINKSIHSIPRPRRSALLTATSQLMEPELGDFGHKCSFVEENKGVNNERLAPNS